MLLVVYWGVVVLLTDVIFGDIVNDLCRRCPGSASNNSIVVQYCNKTNHNSVVRRCCVENTTAGSTVIGLDWSGCDITKLDPYQFASLGDSLQWLDLSGNKINSFNTSRHDRWFGALIKLDRLLLPEGVYCDEKAWRANETFDGLQLCAGPLYCNVSNDLTNKTSNSVCPPNSHCIPDGPGLHQCICNSDRHGYKCIQHTGSFSYAIFFSASVAATISLIIMDRIIRKLIMWHPGRGNRQDSGVQ